jgi:hypothetical protein
MIGERLLTPYYLFRRGEEVARDRNGSAKVHSVIDIVDKRMAPARFDSYGVVVLLADDEMFSDVPSKRLNYELFDDNSAQDDTLFLIAPALPLLEPSRILADAVRPPMVDGQIGCVIDTSLARSPFWTGNPRRAIDRRIADIIIGAAVICSADEYLRTTLIRSLANHDRKAFSFAFDINDSDNENSKRGLLSEFLSVGLNRNSGIGDTGTRSTFKVWSLGKSTEHVRSGYYFYSEQLPVSDFEGFVFAVLADLQEAKSVDNLVDLIRSGAPPIRQTELLDTNFSTRSARTVPPEIRKTLAYPHLAIAITGGGLASVERIIICAEAPSLPTVRAASREGWVIARYTDRETLWEWLKSRNWDSLSPVPREIRLPQLRRLTRNRGLATRGVDPRDIVRLPVDVFEAWRLAAEGSPLLLQIRGYTSSINQEKMTEFAIPMTAVEEAMKSGDPAAEELARIVRDNIHLNRGRQKKRPGDLRAAWLIPTNGTKRFVLEDGHLPVRLMNLPPTAVPAQHLFLIDGDGSVPALFTSRLFDVWARATLSRSTGWSSRFSVSNTFETLPIPREFVVTHEGAEPVQLKLGHRADRLSTLIRQLENDPQALGELLYSDRGVNRDGARVVPSILEEINAALLSAIGLSSGASDLDILERLLEMNREA